VSLEDDEIRHGLPVSMLSTK